MDGKLGVSLFFGEPPRACTLKKNTRVWAGLVVVGILKDVRFLLAVDHQKMLTLLKRMRLNGKRLFTIVPQNGGRKIVLG